MNDQVLLSIVAAIALVFQVQVGWNAAPAIGLQAGMPVQSLCTVVNLNVGCVPAEVSQEDFTGLSAKPDPS